MEKTETRGRPQEEAKPRDIKLTIKLSEEEMRELEEWAKELNMPKSTYGRNLLMTGIEDTKMLNNIGILGLMKGIKNTKNFIKKYTVMREALAIKS